MKTSQPSAETVRAVIMALEELEKRMLLIGSLSAQERRQLRGGRIGPRIWHILQRRLDAARRHRHLLPPGFDLRRLERDVELTGTLQDCLARLDRMRCAVSDTLLVYSSRAIRGGSVAYQHLQIAASSMDPLDRKVDGLITHLIRRRRARPAVSSKMLKETLVTTPTRALPPATSSAVAMLPSSTTEAKHNAA